MHEHAGRQYSPRACRPRSTAITFRDEQITRLLLAAEVIVRRRDGLRDSLKIERPELVGHSIAAIHPSMRWRWPNASGATVVATITVRPLRSNAGCRETSIQVRTINKP